jgi:hypothetical protein
MLAVLEAEGLQWCGSLPPVPPAGALFEPSARPGALALALRRWGWALRCLSDEDAGLVCLVARRPA